MSNVSALFAAAATFTAPGATESVAPVEQRLLAAEPEPVGAVVAVVMLILSS